MAAPGAVRASLLYPARMSLVVRDAAVDDVEGMARVHVDSWTAAVIRAVCVPIRPRKRGRGSSSRRRDRTWPASVPLGCGRKSTGAGVLQKTGIRPRWMRQGRGQPRGEGDSYGAWRVEALSVNDCDKCTTVSPGFRGRGGTRTHDEDRLLTMEDRFGVGVLYPSNEGINGSFGQ